MQYKSLLLLWGGLFALCAGLGFLPEPDGPVKTAMTVLSVAHFLPPAVLLFRAGKEKNREEIRLVRNLAALSLGLTMLLLIGNFLSAGKSEALGSLLHYMLIIISSPMLCSGYWALSLFLWACLLAASVQLLGKKAGNARG